MKILEKGSDQRGFTIETLCIGASNFGGGCGAKLLVSEGDMYLTYSGRSYLENDYTNHVNFTCPCCGVESIVPDNKVPMTVRVSLPDKVNAASRIIKPK